MAYELETVLAQVDSNLEAAIRRFSELVSIPSVSSDPEGEPGIRRAAEWLVGELSALGIPSRVVETGGHPVVLGRTAAPGGHDGPTMLFYGHYDVQPAAPLEAWRTPPFEATRVRDADGMERIYGRGVSDSKGQLWSVVEAFRAWKEVHGSLPEGIVVLFEGEEEAGSESLAGFIDRHREELACDVAFISDSDMWSSDTPAITTRLKGLFHERVTITAPNPDLHSGQYGGVAVNPLLVLSKILAAIHDEDGRITIPGFYDGVHPVPPAVLKQWEGLDISGRGFLAGISVEGGAGERAFSPIERMWSRPAIDFNGIHGGNPGPGERSVLPGSVVARLSFRLVGDQDPTRVRELFRDFVRARLPAGCTAEFHGIEGTSAVTVREDSRFVAATARALEAEWGNPAVVKASGGSVPAVGYLTDMLRVDCVVTGFILADDAIHAPNEKYDIRCFHKGIRSWVRILNEMLEDNA